MRPHGCIGMSRTGTGCATPGRSDAVWRTKPGRSKAAPSATTPAGAATIAARVASELEIDEGIAISLRDHDRERHQRPGHGNRRGGRARDHRLERAVAHLPV